MMRDSGREVRGERSRYQLPDDPPSGPQASDPLQVVVTVRIAPHVWREGGEQRFREAIDAEMSFVRHDVLIEFLTELARRGGPDFRSLDEKRRALSIARFRRSDG